jgi:hypothetical protein
MVISHGLLWYESNQDAITMRSMTVFQPLPFPIPLRSQPSLPFPCALSLVSLFLSLHSKFQNSCCGRKLVIPVKLSEIFGFPIRSKWEPEDRLTYFDDSRLPFFPSQTTTKNSRPPRNQKSFKMARRPARCYRYCKNKVR